MEQNIVEKAKNCKSVEELIALAKDNGAELTSEQAATCFASLHPVEGELAEHELSDVVGGGCSTGRNVSSDGFCENWMCDSCGSTSAVFRESTEFRRCARTSCNHAAMCATCSHVTVDNSGIHYCSK